MIQNSIQFKKKGCMNKYGEQPELRENQIAIYVVLTRKCNVNCKFCEYHNGESNVDVERFTETLSVLSRICNISTVHFTGGEPTLEVEKLKQLCRIIKQTDNWIQTSVNTNGTNLKLLEGIKELDNIALSRHAVDDVENREIFRSELVPSEQEIRDFKDKHKIHLSCNLIKGHVDSADKVIQYLEFAGQLGVNDVGIVSLMDVNDYCNKHYVDFNSLNIQETDRLVMNRCFKNISDNTGEICCKCENYLYRASNMNLISMYHRYAIKNNEIADYLVYEDNILKQGFNGKIICK